MKSKLIWEYKQPTCINNAADCRSVLLANRSILSADEFLQPVNPIQLSASEVGIDEPALIQAADIINSAVEKQHKILIFGDYDVDGVSATAIIWETLRELGLIAQPFIPHRLKHGYGLSIRALKEIWESGKPDLIITVDNGIVAHEALSWLAKEQVPVILTDHHQPDGKLIAAAVVVHSTQISGAAVAWFLARQLMPTSAESYFDLLGLATLADQMPLLGANRAFACYGLQALENTKRAGLQALKKVSQLSGPITSQTAQFSLIPRLNAMGRLDHGLVSLRLLCVRSHSQAAEIAQQLQSTNQDRQQLTFDLQSLALTQAQQQQNEKIIVVQSEDFHEGVIGLLAGKLLETLYKPVIAIQIGEITAKASVRSIPGFDIIQFLRKQQLPFLELGGHALAAGFLISRENVPTVVAAIQSAAQELLTDALLIPKLLLESKVVIPAVTPELVRVIESFQPFGQANPAPVFGIESVIVKDCMAMGSEQQHLKLVLSDQQSHTITGLFWRNGDLLTQLKIGQTISVAGRLELNTWRGQQRVQLVVVAVDVK